MDKIALFSLVKVFFETLAKGPGKMRGR